MNRCFAIFAVVVAGIVGQSSTVSSERSTPGGAVANRVLSLNGKTDYVQVADSPSLHSFQNAITMECWFNASSFGVEHGSVNSILRKNVAQGGENFLLRFRILEGRPVVETNPGREFQTLLAPYKFAKGQWYHLAATYDGSVISAYVNGIRIGSEDVSGAMHIDGSDLFIGKGDPEWSSGEYFDGALDEIRLWNVARSPEQIRSNMNTPLTGKEPGLVLYMNFDDGTAKDVSPNGNHGTLHEKAGIVEQPRTAVAVPDAQAAEAAEASRLTTDERMEVLEALWRNLSEIYPALEYKGIDGRAWIEPAERRVREAKTDKEFYDILQELMASLADTHTRIISHPGQPRLEAPPVMLNRVEGRVAVIRAQADTGLAPGDVITSIDGRPVEACLAEHRKRVCNSTERGRVREACGQLLRGAPNTTVTVTALGADGTTRRVALRRGSSREFWREPTISSRPLNDAVGYIRIARWSDSSIPDTFDRALDTFRKTKGIIIDVRGNGGGNDQLADQVNGRLIEKPVISSIDFWRTAGTDEYRKGIGWVRPRGPWTYKGRVAVLIDEASMSACEHFVSGVEAMGNVLLVGAPTNGAGGGPTTVRLPDGTRVAISRALGLRVNGVVFEGHGIPPHIFSTPTLDDLRKGRDAALEIAKEWILSDKDVPARSQSLPRTRK